MSGLLNFLQGASNAAASNVSAPVDGLAWLLKKAGVNVGTPVGGSDWMRQQGLTADAPGLGGLLGESVGGVLPMVAAAKAPQIASGLLKVGENAAARPMLNPQTGAVVWHGSPHKFDKFDSSKIGTGEGAQAYGHGLYLAESPEVGGQYARMNLTGPANVAHVAGRDGGDALSALKRVYPGMPTQWYESAIRKGADAGNLYKVDLPDEKIARMLDWDKPLSQQPEVLKALTKEYSPSWVNQFKDKPGSDLYKAISGGEGIEDLRRAGADELRRQGIPGIRYLDGGSRGAGAGSSNFVVFPGEEGALKILERNGGLLK